MECFRFSLMAAIFSLRSVEWGLRRMSSVTPASKGIVELPHYGGIPPASRPGQSQRVLRERVVGRGAELESL